MNFSHNKCRFEERQWTDPGRPGFSGNFTEGYGAAGKTKSLRAGQTVTLLWLSLGPEAGDSHAVLHWLSVVGIV